MFVRLDYYCESGITGQWEDNQRIALDDPLWDGDGCGPDNSCCNQTGLPWFYRNLPQKVGDDIEVRLCANQGIADEEIYMRCNCKYTMVSCEHLQPQHQCV